MRLPSLCRPRLLSSFLLLAAGELPASGIPGRVAVVTDTPGCVAFWDFVKREPAGARRLKEQGTTGAKNDWKIEGGNYVRDDWGEGREAVDDDGQMGRAKGGTPVRREDLVCRLLLEKKK